MMPKEKKTLLDFWEDQMRQSHTSSNYFFRKSPSHYHMMLLVMSAYKEDKKLSVEELKTKLFKTSRPKSALIITEACEKGFFRLEKTSTDQRIKNIMPSESFIKEFNDYLILGVPTRFFRDWIVSRYLDKILEQVKNFKLSLNRIEFKIIEESKNSQDIIKIDQLK